MNNPRISSIVLLLLRITFGFRIIYGVVDNIISWEKMLEFKSFLEGFNFPLPLPSAVASVYIQAIAGLLWVLGYQTKLAALLMIANFSVALIGIHFRAGHSYLEFAPALHLLVVAIVLYLAGPGKYALDNRKRSF